MIIYILVAVFPLIISNIYYTATKRNCLSSVDKNKYKVKLLIISSIPMFITMGFRGYYTGTDTIQYVRSFIRATDKPFVVANIIQGRREAGFSFFEFIIAKTTSNPTIYLCICSLIMLLAVMYFGYITCEEPILFMYFYVTLGSYAFMMTAHRQGLAMSLCLFSVGFIKKRKFIPFLVLVLLAFNFHKSAIFFIVVYFIAYLEVNGKNISMYFVSIIVFLLFFSSIQNWVGRLLGYEYGIEETGNAQVFFAIILLIVIFALIYRKNILLLSKYNIILFNMSFITAGLWSARLISRTAERPAYFFQFSIYALLVQLIASIKDKKEKNIIYFTIVALTFVLYIIRTNGLTFKFFWQ